MPTARDEFRQGLRAILPSLSTAQELRLCELVKRSEQDRVLDRAHHREDEGRGQKQNSGPAPSRRPSLSVLEQRRWQPMLDALNAVRDGLRESLDQSYHELRARVHALGAPRATPEHLTVFLLDQYGRQILQEWSVAPQRVADQFKRGLFWFGLLGALDTFVEPESGRLDELRFPGIARGRAERFLAWWTPERLSTHVPRHAQRFARLTLGLLRSRSEAIPRLRRCRYSGCGRWFFDASPTFQTAPARACTHSHAVTARDEERRQARRTR